MKKSVAAALVLAMVLSLSACGDKEPAASVSEDKTTEVSTETSVSASEEKAEASAEEETETSVEEAAPVIPEGYSLVELTSDYLGVKVSFAALDDGRFAGSSIELNKNTSKYGRTEYNVNFFSSEEWKNKDNVRMTVRIWARSNEQAEKDLSRYTALEGSEYVGCWHSEIEDSTKCYFEVFTEENSYLDGRVEAEFDMYAYQDFMDLEEYKTMVDNIIKSVKIEISPDNNLNDANGDFPSTWGLYTVPAKVTIDGNECDTYWMLTSSAPHAEITFKDADSKTVVIREDGQNVPKYVSSRKDDTEKNRPVTFGDYSGICITRTGSGNIEHEYTIVYAQDGDNETNITFYVTLGEVKSFSSQELKDLFGDEAQVAELNAKLDAYAEEYFSQLVFNE